MGHVGLAGNCTIFPRVSEADRGLLLEFPQILRVISRIFGLSLWSPNSNLRIDAGDRFEVARDRFEVARDELEMAELLADAEGVLYDRILVLDVVWKPLLLLAPRQGARRLC